MEHIPATSIILPNIRSTYNVGSIFRTADAVGVEHIYLVGYTPAPVDRFGRKRKDIAKTALGAEESVSWSMHPDVTELISNLQSYGVMCVAVEQSPRSKNYKNIQVKKPVAFIFGNEVEGLSQDVLKQVDVVVDIPQKGLKESLNVSVAVGVVLYGVLDN